MNRRIASAVLAMLCGLAAPVAQARPATPSNTDAQTLQGQDRNPVANAPGAAPPRQLQQAPNEPGVVPARAVGQTHDCSTYYPVESVRAGETGSVTVGYDVGADGVIGNVHINRSSGFDRLDQAVLACIHDAWRNTPAMKDGVAVASPGHISIVTFSVR